MKRILFFFILFCFYSLIISGNSVYLRDYVEVSDSVVKFKDIAMLDSTLRNKIGDLVISASPDLGHSQLISKNEVFEKLKGNGVRLNIKGSDTVKIVRKGINIKPDYFKKIILDYVSKNSKWGKDIQIKIISSKNIIIPAKGVMWQIFPAQGQDFFGNVLFKIKAFDKGEQIYNGWIVADIKIIKKIPIANRRIMKGEVINKSDIRWEKRELTPFIKNAILDEKNVINKRAGRIISTNSVITEELMEKRFLVRRGQPALLVAVLKNIKATTSVIPLKSAGYGERIRVINPVSKKVLSAVVKDKNKLEVIVE